MAFLLVVFPAKTFKIENYLLSIQEAYHLEVTVLVAFPLLLNFEYKKNIHYFSE